MSADTLRRAAALLRKHAEAATPGPWIVTDPNEGSGHPPFWQVVNDAYLNPRDEDAPALEVELHTGVEADARYLSLVHPPVALALADWLDAMAEFVQANYDHDGFDLSGDETYRGGVAVARAILREPAEGERT